MYNGLLQDGTRIHDTLGARITTLKAWIRQECLQETAKKAAQVKLCCEMQSDRVGYYANTCPKNGEKKETEVLKVAYGLGYEPLEDSDIDSDIKIYAYTNSSIYNYWAIASTHIIRKSVSHKSYLTKEAAEKALGESYKTVTTEEVQKSQQFVSLNQHLQSQTAKLNAINKMKNVLTTSERQEMRIPSVEKFQRLWDSLISYNDVHTTMMFYLKRREPEPKAVFFPQASSRDVYDYFIHGLVNSLYFHSNNPRELQEFPPKVQNTIRVYNNLFAKGREVYLKMHSSFPIFNRERKLVVPSITIAQLRVSNQDYPSKDVNMKPTTPTLDDLALSLFRVYTGSSKIGSGPGRTKKVRINYYSKNFLIYSHFQEKINEVQIKALADFEDQFKTFSGLLAPLREDLNQLLCGYLSRTPRHHCQYCDKGINIPMTEV
ncbi:hypothetical protein Tco_1101623 [Tanacetum coccineum]